MKIVRRKSIRLLAAGLLSGLAVTILGAKDAAAAYPDHTVQLVVGTAPGGSIDTIARIVAAHLQAAWHQSVVVVNKPGASTTIGTEDVVHAAPDGYTLLVSNSNLTITPSMMKVNYDPVGSFAPVSMVVTLPEFIVVNTKIGVKTLKDLVELAKSEPGKLNYSSGGNGSLSYLGMIDFMNATGTKVQAVTYSSGGPMMVGLLGNETQIMLTSLPSTSGNIGSGKILALAATTKERYSQLPNVPTVAEQAGAIGAPRLANFDVADWDGVLAPAGTPPAIVDQIQSAIAAQEKTPAMLQALAQGGYAPQADLPADFTAFLKQDVVNYNQLFKEASSNQ